MKETQARSFAIPDLWGPSKWLGSVDGHSSFLFSELKLDGVETLRQYRKLVTDIIYIDIDEKLPEIIEPAQYDDIFFSLPDISFGPAETPSTPSQSTDESKDLPNALDLTGGRS